jgi:hypothetical protein
MLIGHQRLSFSFGHSANYRKHHPPVFVSSPRLPPSRCAAFRHRTKVKVAC